MNYYSKQRPKQILLPLEKELKHKFKLQYLIILPYLFFNILEVFVQEKLSSLPQLSTEKEKKIQKEEEKEDRRNKKLNENNELENTIIPT